ncbi:MULTISPECIES: serine hydrolase [Gulbenkiania]|uniref:D-alanyl-D-alanine carboxypeptidase n=1 Tax=Gulbenkiania indica TaxID=375574 RepID=A0A0K6GUP4_9NEIS|nr:MULTISPECIES: serine hydrolase [Gulbenkiania]CUA82264.1 D-alanyl-D-alanine carboxypeptidase [Gulbenkiania indica]
MLKRIASGLVAIVLAMPAVAAAPAGIEVATSMAGEAVPHLNSSSVLVLNGLTGEPVYQKNPTKRVPIASITKLMTAMVILDSGVSLEEPVTITDAEIDRLKNTSSRLAIGTTLSRRELLLLALMSSENRAAAALARSYPGGTQAFVARMNRKARSLGMSDTIYYDPTGLDVRNTSTANDLARMVRAAYGYPLIRAFSTTHEHSITAANNRVLQYKNSNALVRSGEWEINLQKTGYIQEAGRCLVMHATVGTQPLIIVLLAAGGPSARVNDAKAIRTWLEGHPSSWLAG